MNIIEGLQKVMQGFTIINKRTKETIERKNGNFFINGEFQSYIKLEKLLSDDEFETITEHSNINAEIIVMVYDTDFWRSIEAAKDIIKEYFKENGSLRDLRKCKYKTFEELIEKLATEEYEKEKSLEILKKGLFFEKEKSRETITPTFYYFDSEKEFEKFKDERCYGDGELVILKIYELDW